MWATLPMIYSAHFAFHGRTSGAAHVSSLFTKHGAAASSNSVFSAIVPRGVDERMFLVFILQLLWSIRLTGNTLRRGFFDFTSEDYRWPIVRRIMPKWVWVIFDLTFISFYQNYLLLSTALTQYFLLTSSRAYHPSTPTTPLGWPDYAIAAVFIANLAIEQTADLQQQFFQNWKHGKGTSEGKGGRIASGANQRQAAVAEGDLRRGFVTSGLWAWSRHPNFICEQLNFWILSLFTLRATVPQAVFDRLLLALKTAFDQREPRYLVNAVKAASPHLFNYTWLAPILMSSLFIGSTTLTEYLSAGKYPLYKSYQRRVGMFFPSTTVLKAVWLGLTGQLTKVNEDVWGAAKSKKS